MKIRPKIGLYLPNKNGPMGKNGLVQIGLLFIHIGREKRPITQHSLCLFFCSQVMRLVIHFPPWTQDRLVISVCSGNLKVSHNLIS